MMIPAASLLALAAYVAAQADPSINTPAAVVQCQPVQINYIASKGPVFVSILPGGQASAAPIQSLGVQTTSPFTWVANIASGTPITFQLRDSAGAVAYSAPITIQPSSDSSCLGVQDPTTAAGTAVPGPSVAPTPATSTFCLWLHSTAHSFPAYICHRGYEWPDPIPSGLPFNAAAPNAKVGLPGLLGLAAAIIMV